MIWEYDIRAASTFANSEGGDTLFDDDHGRVTYARRTYPTASVDLEVYRYGGAATKVVGYLPESAVQSRAAWPTTSGWDLGFDRFGRPIRTYIYKNGAGTYVDLRVSHDDNSNISAVENAWVTPWSATYESDGLNRLKGAKQGVMTSGSISTIVQQEDWQTAGGSLKLDQLGNWIDYTRKRETVTQDEWQNNTFSGINTYTKIDKVSGSDWLPEYNAKGLSKKDDSSGGSTKGYQYTYDAWDRLVRVTLTTAGGSAEVAAYRYNGLGHRIARAWDDNKDSVVDSSDTWHHLQTNERWQEVAVWKAGDTDVMEVFTYGQAGMDGYGGSSYIDAIICRERDITTNGSFDDRYYYLQNWRHDVVAMMTYDGAIKERVMYDAYGRPHSFSPGDIKGGGGSSNDRPDGILNSTDTWATGSVAWNRDLGNSSGVAIPDGVVDANDGTTLTNLKTAGYSGGWGLLSSSAIGNRKGYAGYEFDGVLNGAAGVDEKPVYHVRHRVLASDTGKWLQKDPMGYVDGMDLYEYFASNPMSRVFGTIVYDDDYEEPPDFRPDLPWKELTKWCTDSAERWADRYGIPKDDPCRKAFVEAFMQSCRLHIELWPNGKPMMDRHCIKGLQAYESCSGGVCPPNARPDTSWKDCCMSLLRNAYTTPPCSWACPDNLFQIIESLVWCVGGCATRNVTFCVLGCLRAVVGSPTCAMCMIGAGLGCITVCNASNRDPRPLNPTQSSLVIRATSVPAPRDCAACAINRATYAKM